MSNALLHSPADVVRWCLVSLALGTDPNNIAAWPVYTANEPALPDNCVTTYDTVGKSDGRSMVTGELFTHYGFQVRIRGKDEATGRPKAEAIRTAMAESVYQETVTIGNEQYLIHAITGIGQVLPLGTETPTSKRVLYTVNALVNVKLLD